MSKDPNILTLSAACRLLGISRTTAYKRITAGELVPLPYTGLVSKQRYRFDRAYLLSFLTSPQKEEAAPPPQDATS